jgi:hypothetical protein
MESFYGGKRGFSFIFQENKREGSDGLWTSLGTVDDEDNLDTLYSGIKRGDVKPGEYAVIKNEENNYIYRIDLKLNPILIAILEIPKGKNGEPGRAAQWWRGNALTHNTGMVQLEIPNSAIDDMYLNDDSGNVYIRRANDYWEYTVNIKGPKGETGGSEIVVVGYSAEAGEITVQKLYYNEALGIASTREIDFSAIREVSFDGQILWENGQLSETDLLGEATDTIGDYMNYTGNGVLGHYTYAYCWSNFKKENDKYISIPDVNPNKLYAYSGGHLPPALLVTPRVTVFYGINPATEENPTETGGTRMVPGFYLILNGHFVRIDSWANLSDVNVSSATYPFYGLGLFWGCEANQPIENSYINIVNLSLDNNTGKITAPPRSIYSMKRVSDASQGILKKKIVYIPNKDENYQGTLEVLGVTSPWDFVKLIMGNAAARLIVSSN